MVFLSKLYSIAFFLTFPFFGCCQKGLTFSHDLFEVHKARKGFAVSEVYGLH